MSLRERSADGQMAKRSRVSHIPQKGRRIAGRRRRWTGNSRTRWREIEREKNKKKKERESEQRNERERWR